MYKVILFLYILLSAAANSQERPGGGGSISGRIIDANSAHAIEYANIVIFRESDSSQVSGSVSNPEGSFIVDRIPPGKYYADILFMGYERERLGGIEISRSNLSVDLGEIQIKPSAVSLGDVVIEQDRPSLTYQIDKKVINVEQMGASFSGTAAEVLENIPSVAVDIEGNVTLRGSGNFTVLVDGRPSIVDPQDVLQQIPASTIESIEIITNPSAKYNPEGTAGIINIILKKNRSAGVSGIVNLNAGMREKYGGDALFEYKTSTLSTIFGIDYNNRSFPGTDNSENRYVYENGATVINSFGDTKRGRESFGLRGSVDVNLGLNNFVTLGGRYNNREMNRSAVLVYDRWTESTGINTLSTNNNYRERGGHSFSLNLGYVKRFEKQGHELSSDIVFSRQEADENTISELLSEGIILEGVKTTEQGPSKELNARLDYVLPLGESNRLESGYQGEVDIADEYTTLQNYNVETGTYELLPLYSNDIRFEENEHAIYSTYSGKFSQFGYQLGLRGEYTHRIISLLSPYENFTIDRWDYFPTFHTSYEFAPGTQIMASYTRRINRPRGWALEPFLTWFDANTVRQGNPALIPEFINSFEVGGQTYISTVSVSAEFYYLKTLNKIEGVRSVYPGAEDVTLQTFSNVGTDYSLGTELMINSSPFEFWDINLMGNIYNYKIKGTLYNEPFSRSSFNWRGRMNNVFKFGSSTQLQFNFMYHSPSVSSQGTRAEYISSEFAVRQDLLNKRLSLILQVRDVFGSTLHEFTSEGPGFYSFTSMQNESPIVMLTARFNINSYKQDRKGQREDGGFMEGEEL